MTSNKDRFISLLAAKYELLFQSEQYAQVARNYTPLSLANEMTLKLQNGTADNQGLGVKLTCKELGIKNTYTAIKTYLGSAT